MILLAQHDPTWAREFSQEAQLLLPAFGALLIELHHIGSTAVRGILAKPVIDILAIVSDVHALDAQTRDIGNLGYEAMGEFGLPGRRYFRKDNYAGVRTHQIHAYASVSADEIERHLNFRDYLREHPATARAYSDLKRALVDRCRSEMRCYSDGKTTFIREVERLAVIWRRESGFTRRPYNDRCT